MIKNKLDTPENYEVKSILSLGVSEKILETQNWEVIQQDKTHKKLF